MEYLMGLVLIVAGIAIGYLVANLKGSKSQQESQLAVEKNKTELAFLQQKIGEVEAQKSAALQEAQKLQSTIADLREKSGKLEAQNESLQIQFKEYKLEVQSLEDSFKSSFKGLAADILKEQSKDFSVRNVHLLQPFKQQLSAFEEKVNQQIKENIERAATFKAQVEQLKDLNIQISQEAQNLTKALKGDNKLQGNWGELVLERVLEASGLEKGSEYEMQVSLENVDDNRIQPDAIVYLPDEKHLIIDAKVSLVAYEQFVNAESEEDRTRFIKEHIASVKAHVKGLSDKKYQTAKGLTTPDFILLFIPIEASFGAAVKEDVSLFNYAWDLNVVIVSPSTLLATLRTITSLWKQEKQNKNVLLIAQESGKLYDKFVGFMKDLEGIQSSMEKTSQQFEEATKKLHSGKGNLIGRVEKLKQLGAKTTKQIDEKYLED